MSLWRASFAPVPNLLPKRYKIAFVFMALLRIAKSYKQNQRVKKLPIFCANTLKA